MSGVRMSGMVGARISLWGHRLIDGGNALLRDGFSALCLGILSDEQLDDACELAFTQRFDMRNAGHARSGFYAWERAFVDQFLTPGATVLVSSAGAGREVLALSRRGFNVAAFECNPKLVDWGNELLRAEGVSARIAHAEPSQCPAEVPSCNAVIVGWGSYHHVRPAKRRVLFLQALRQRVTPGAPLLCSFFERRGADSTRASHWGNRIRRLRRRAQLDPGDVFGPPPMHLFTQEEIELEMEQGGFKVQIYCKEPYPHVVAAAID